MIKFDFSEYVDNYVDKDKYLELLDKKNNYINKLNNSQMTGWTREISEDVVSDIKNTSQFIKNNFINKYYFIKINFYLSKKFF